GVVTAKFLVKNVKYAILIIFIIAAIITPTADPVTQSLVAGPMILLYGVSIVIAWVFQKRTPKTDGVTDA
ncbi:MAG: twin-arginine translocase subunit TatC, partial [Vicinamibacterales bacterium]|nr:twin-arginine translocase subunit TatC [Vicinamibacterales bacterium]